MFCVLNTKNILKHLDAYDDVREPSMSELNEMRHALGIGLHLSKQFLKKTNTVEEAIKLYNNICYSISMGNI